MWYTCRQWNEIVHFLCDTLCIQSLCECEFCTHRYSSINISYVADCQVTGQVDWDDRLTWNDLVSVVLLLYFVCLIECVFEPICISVFLRIHCFPVLNTLTVSSVQLQLQWRLDMRHCWGLDLNDLTGRTWNLCETCVGDLHRLWHDITSAYATYWNLPFVDWQLIFSLTHFVCFPDFFTCWVPAEDTVFMSLICIVFYWV